MCGIIGYNGTKQATSILLNGLKALEYRGYDSAGVAYFDDQGAICTHKAVGRVANLEKEVLNNAKTTTCGIGHTRWATHGMVNKTNAHPHTVGLVSVVHNGIIENYVAKKNELGIEGVRFTSETDTEVIAAIINSKYLGEPIEAIRSAMGALNGSYAVGVMFADRPGELYATRKDSPLIVGKNEFGTFLTSDISAIITYTNEYYILEEGEIAFLKNDSVSVYNEEGPKSINFNISDLDIDSLDKNHFEHYMLKEIFEEPTVISKTLSAYIVDGRTNFALGTLSEQKISRYNRIHIIGCGTAMHSGLAGKYLFAKHARLDVSVEIASEFRYAEPILSRYDLAIFISQSGETADTLAALRLCKARGVKTLAIVNTQGTAIAREADDCIFTYAGREISVASTKAYSAQVAILYLLSIHFGKVRYCLEPTTAKELVGELLLKSVENTKAILLDKEKIEAVASKVAGSKDAFFIGRGLDYYIALEAALKLKEVSYIHCEAYAAGELKHGTISLVENCMPVIAIATNADLLSKTLSNLEEVKARGAYTILFASSTLDVKEDMADDVVILPSSNGYTDIFSATTALQLLAYYTAYALGCDIDKPKNLAKSVTVE